MVCPMGKEMGEPLECQREILIVNVSEDCTKICEGEKVLGLGTTPVERWGVPPQRLRWGVWPKP